MLAAMRKSNHRAAQLSALLAPDVWAPHLLSTFTRGMEIECLVVRSQKTGKRDTAKLARQVKARVVELGSTVARQSRLVWITVPDDAIAAVAAQLASNARAGSGTTVFHSSGALTSDVLAPLRAKGAKIASVHPGMTFVHKSVPRLKACRLEWKETRAPSVWRRRSFATLGEQPFTIRKKNKVLYHAFDTFASPMVIALMAALERWAKRRGSSHRISEPWPARCFGRLSNNYLEHGAAAAFSGPLIRGDVATVRRHLEALRKTSAGARGLCYVWREWRWSFCR